MKPPSKRQTALVVLAVLVLIIAAAACVLHHHRSNDTVATIYVNGTALYSFDLSTITDSTTFTIGEPGAQNTIEVSPQGIAVIAADCPDQVCVQQGVRAHGPTPIVCLPHKLSIRFSENGDTAPDAVTG